MAKFLAAVFIAVAAIPFIVVVAIANGWAISALWGWFVVPVFGLPLLSISQAVGLGVLVSYMTTHVQQPEEEDGWTEKKMAFVVTTTIRPFMAVLIGWIVTFFL